MSKPNQPVEPSFREKIKTMVADRAAARLQYYTDIHEFITRFGTFKELISREGEEYLVLTTGEKIRLDRIARIDDKPAPGYDEDFFQCDLGR